jgi:uncharacterized membrane protein
MTTVAAIADAAFDAVGAAITDAILAVAVTRVTQGAYNVTTGAYAETETTQTGRAVLADERAIADIFPAYTVGPRDQMFILEGLTSLREADTFTAGGKTYAVGAVQDIVGAGTLFMCVAQEVPT